MIPTLQDLRECFLAQTFEFLGELTPAQIDLVNQGLDRLLTAIRVYVDFVEILHNDKDPPCPSPSRPQSTQAP